jgi:hypothetical protein
MLVVVASMSFSFGAGAGVGVAVPAGVGVGDVHPESDSTIAVEIIATIEIFKVLFHGIAITLM